MTASECACGCGRPAPGAAFAPPCTAVLRRDLRRLPELYRDLEALMDPRRGAASCGGNGDGLPWHEPAAECRSQIAHDLEYWARRLEAVRGLPPLARESVPAMCGWLHAQVTVIVRHAWSADMAAALADDRRRAVALLDPMPRASIPLPGACPECGAAGLRAVVPQDDRDRRPAMAGCDGCGAVWDTTQWARLGRLLAGKAA